MMMMTIIIIRMLLIIVLRRRPRAVARTSNTTGHDYHEKSSWRVSMSMGLRLAALRATGAPQLKLDTSLIFYCWFQVVSGGSLF